jgi:molybdopterin-guanine dinucleotide biosynthesis protein A
MLAGRPLASYPVEALAGVCDRVAVVCRPGAELPDLGEAVERWDEPASPRRPAAGIVHALERAGGPVLVCAGDMPFVTPDACRTLMSAAGTAGDSPAVVAAAAGVLQPVFGLYGPAALGPFKEAPEDAPLTRTVEALDPVRVALPPALVKSVNTPEDLAEAESLMGGTGPSPSGEATRRS